MYVWNILASTLCILTRHLTSHLHCAELCSDAMFKLACVEISLVYDQKMYEMIEQGSEGGTPQTFFRKYEQLLFDWVATSS